MLSNGRALFDRSGRYPLVSVWKAVLRVGRGEVLLVVIVFVIVSWFASRDCAVGATVLQFYFSRLGNYRGRRLVTVCIVFMRRTVST